MNNYYIYFHIKSDDKSIFYVGKGKGRRALVKSCRSLHWNNTVSKHGYDIVYKEINLSEEEAILREKYWISYYGRLDNGTGCLVNFTDGGEGTSGRSMNEYTKRVISQCNKNRPPSENQKKAVGSLYKGKSGSLHNRSIPVRCIETGEGYGSQSEAERQLGLGAGCVRWSIKYKKPIFGMHFEISN